MPRWTPFEPFAFSQKQFRVCSLETIGQRPAHSVIVNHAKMVQAYLPPMSEGWLPLYVFIVSSQFY